MKFFCIGDADTAAGFRLAGIAAHVTTTREQAAKAVQDVAVQPECGVIIITERLADLIRNQIEAMRLERDRPLIVEIPGPGGRLPGRKSLRDFVQEAVGMRI